MGETQDILRSLGMRHAVYSQNFAGPDNDVFTVGIKDGILQSSRSLTNIMVP